LSHALEVGTISV
jgi:hypothetical protein